MHIPRVAGASVACAALQRLYNHYLRTIYHLSQSTPSRLLLTELGLLLLQVFWWQQTLQFWNSLAAPPVVSLQAVPHCLLGQPYQCLPGGCLQYG